MFQSELTSIPSQALKNMAVLDTLLLSYNSIPNVPDYAFQTLSSLKTLKVDNNPITDSGFSANSFSGLSQLTTLSLASTRLTAVPINALQTVFCSLQTLSLSGNNISNIPSNMFQNFAKLQSFDISNNPLTSFQPSTFAGIGSNMFTLTASLPTIGLDAFSGMPNVQNMVLKQCAGKCFIR